MVAGTTTCAKSIDQVVVDKVITEPALKKQWKEVSTRFRLVFADPETSFRKVDVDAMLKDKQAAETTLSKLAKAPDSFGALKGNTGFLASRADKQEREQANRNASALARDLERYLRLRAEAERRYEAEESATRLKVAVDIPALSPAAKNTLERIRDAIDRNDLPAALGFALEDKMVGAELEGFARAVSERFGERSFTGVAAKEADGKAFKALSEGMTAAQRQELKAAWPDIRTGQQLAAQQRTAEALKQAETMRQTQSQGLRLQ